MCAQAPIIIGNYVIFDLNFKMITGDHLIDIVGHWMTTVTGSEKLPENDLPIILTGDNWIGANSTKLKGVTVGEEAVASAGVLVTKEVGGPRLLINVFEPLEFTRGLSNIVGGTAL